MGWRLLSSVLLLTCGAGCGQALEHPAAAGAPIPAPGLDLAPRDEPGACVGASVHAEPLPVDLVAVVDRSQSMHEATMTGVSKWYATKSAFRDFLAQAQPGMGLGLLLFPVPGDHKPSCDSEYYRAAAVPIGDVHEVRDEVLAALEGTSAHGQTPTGPALTAALALASAHATAQRERSVIVVLATDGEPSTCEPITGPELAALAGQALHATGSVRTLVVASPALDHPVPPSLDAIALAGGTGRALSIDPRADFAAQLSQLLGVAAARKVACDLALPEPPLDERLDYDAVNVVLAADGARVVFPRVAGPASCTASGGWYYDVDPAQGPPSRLNLCQGSCERLNDADSAELQVELGCKTVVH